MSINLESRFLSSSNVRAGTDTKVLQMVIHVGRRGKVEGGSSLELTPQGLGRGGAYVFWASPCTRTPRVGNVPEGQALDGVAAVRGQSDGCDR